MVKYCIKRILLSILILFGVSLILYFLVRLMPVSYLENKHGKLEFANFRSKRLGYHVSVMEERFESGKVQFGSARTNLMSKIFFRNAADRPICYTWILS